MIVQIGNWIELSFWQIAVRALSGLRPLSGRIAQAKQIIESQPASRALRNGSAIAVSGWLLGLGLGFAFAFIW
ncbi:MAG: hypothetical protein WEC37_02775 [Anaerolineales bacterium]